MTDKKLLAFTLGLAAFLVYFSFLWQGATGYNLSDEGFLWYGVQRVLAGEVPLRDFMAYDPGRYYWSAALLKLAGADGIIALRAAVALFQAIGLATALWLIMAAGRGRQLAYLVVCGITLLMWMWPRHKLFDATLSILLVAALSYLVRQPDARRYFVTGLCVGLAAVFGRNHGMYGALASAGVIIWLSLRRSEGPTLLRGAVLWACGVVAGFAPVLLMLLLVPGFSQGFWDSVLLLFEAGATNLTLPVPWPWKVQWAGQATGDALRAFLIGLFFVGMLAYGLLSIAWVVWRKWRNQFVEPVCVATAFLALPYAQYALSRADIGHLAQNIFPLMIGCMALLATQARKVKWPAAALLCMSSIWVIFVYHPGWQARNSGQWTKLDLSSDRLLVDPDTVNNVAMLRSLAVRYVPDGRALAAMPLWPGAYATLGRKAPVWDIYPLFPRSARVEQGEIERMKQARTSMVFILDVALDGRDELRYQHTHPLTYRYLQNDFTRIDGGPNPAYQVYVANDLLK
ncbi:hypothetical protein SAMN05518865_109203 [Duganella sp. CF458]|uniref:hypothetical protein n=1 Tax=Duganella sp. CF458 TaxID=1884368 RepID=UPI0008F16347|nr:hypothetical protein [Duganella sp. CF458]SFG21020.1 hypothetical protein SAMN05518865_109203 [Duganella sp. CF458]